MATPIVVFDYAAWLVRYPEFTAVTEPRAQSFFDEATLFQRNDGTGPISDPAVQLRLLNMLTAHIAQLNAGSSIQPLTPLVGRINSAAEGSVNVSTENQYEPGTPQWFQQTQYGSSWWAATRSWRTARYIAGPKRVMDPFAPANVLINRR